MSAALSHYHRLRGRLKAAEKQRDNDLEDWILNELTAAWRGMDADDQKAVRDAHQRKAARQEDKMGMRRAAKHVGWRA